MEGLQKVEVHIIEVPDPIWAMLESQGCSDLSSMIQSVASNLKFPTLLPNKVDLWQGFRWTETWGLTWSITWNLTLTI
jgi:hypothetical protein